MTARASAGVPPTTENETRRDLPVVLGPIVRNAVGCMLRCAVTALVQHARASSGDQ